jgi:hypothetical protein
VLAENAALGPPSESGKKRAAQQISDFARLRRYKWRGGTRRDGPLHLGAQNKKHNFKLVTLKNEP